MPSPSSLQAFKSYERGFVHMDVKYLPQMKDESSRRYLFVAIDRATRWVFVHQDRCQCAGLPQGLSAQDPELLTENGKEFTYRLFASREH